MMGDAPVSKLLAETVRDGLAFVGAAFVIGLLTWLIANHIAFPNPAWPHAILVGFVGPGALLITRALRRYTKG